MHRQFAKRLVVVTFSAALAVSACGRKPEPAEVVVTLKDAPGSLSAATVLVDYSQASATPFRSGGEPACAAIVPNVTAHFTDDGQGAITIQASARNGFSAPLDLAVCRMVPDAPGITADAISSKLRVSLVSGTDLAGKAVEEHRLAHADSARGAEPGDEAQGGAMHAHHERAAASAETPEEPEQAVPPGASEKKHATPPEERLAAVPTPPAHGEKPRPEAPAPQKLVPDSRDRSASRGQPPAADRGSDDSGGDDTGDQGAGREDANEDTDTDPKAISYDVTIAVTSAVGPIGALQFNIVHHGEGGGFAGARATARCRPMVPSALASFNDVGNGTLRAGIIDVGGFATPGPVVICTFKSRSSVSSTDFSVEVVDATDPDAQPKTLQLAVTDLVALNP